MPFTVSAYVVEDYTVEDPDAEFPASCNAASLPPAGTRFVAIELSETNDGRRRADPPGAAIRYQTKDSESMHAWQPPGADGRATDGLRVYSTFNDQNGRNDCWPESWQTRDPAKGFALATSAAPALNGGESRSMTVVIAIEPKSSVETIWALVGGADPIELVDR